MPYCKECYNRGTYFLIEYSGSIGYDDLPKKGNLFEDIYKLCKANNCNNVLIDARSLNVDLHISYLYFIGEDISALADPDFKFAFLSRKDQIREDNFVEIVAVNRGSRVKTFVDIEETKKWFAL